MSTYAFETISAAQALSFNGASDSLVFSSSETGASDRLFFQSNGAITVASDLGGHQVTFGAGLAGATQILYADGSLMLVGSPAADLLTGGAHDDGLFGGFGSDILIGGAGDDALQGGPGADVLTGGGGRDLFMVDGGDSPPTAGQMDTVTDWQSTDGLSFFRGATDPASYVEGSAADFASAKAFANAQIAGGTIEYVAMQVGSDVVVFADSHGDHGVADDAVILAGRTLADIDASNIVTTAIFPHAPTLLPTTPPSPPAQPDATIDADGPADGILGQLGSADFNSVQLDATFIRLQSTALAGTPQTYHPVDLTIEGSGFTYDDDGNPVGGVVQSIILHTLTPTGSGELDAFQLSIVGASLPLAPIAAATEAGDVTSLTNLIFGGNDFWFGSDGGDVMRAQGGNDTLAGRSGADTLAGGAGSNLFLMAPGESPAAAGQMDTILDWSALDHLSFGGASGAASNFAETTAGGFSAALAAANAQIAGGAIEYVAVQVNSDVIVFADSRGDHGVADDAVILSGRTLTDFTAGNILAARTASSVVGGDGGRLLQAPGGNSTVQGGTGDDTIVGAPASDYLRGNDGDDSIQGGAGFDDINGNKGNDTISGDLTVGSDWLVGGQGNDSITAHAGQNLVYGNLGNDTLQGGAGADIIRGGQGDDVLAAGSGNQFLSGDRGNDTITAGSGNDTIHSSQDAGIDRILNFNPGHDIVELDPGTTYSVSQVGADTVITMTGSLGTNEVILVGVQMTSLTGNWIFEG